MFRAKTLLTLISKVKNLCQWSAQIGFVRVSLLTNSFTTFCRFRLSVRSLWNFRSIRELNLASKIVDRSQVFRFLANQKGSFSCSTYCSINSYKLNYNDNFGNQKKKKKSLVKRFCICCLTSSEHSKCSFWHIKF